MADAGNINMTLVEDKTVEDEPLLYANKQVLSLDTDIQAINSHDIFKST